MRAIAFRTALLTHERSRVQNRPGPWDWICPTSKQNESVLVREMSVNDGQS
jgi:hypothetical protein